MERVRAEESEMVEIVRLEAVNKARWNGRVALRRFVTGVCTNTECPVCLSDFADGTPIWRLSCGHGGCASPSCLFNSLTNNAQKQFECPLCRCEFPMADPPAPAAESAAPPGAGRRERRPPRGGGAPAPTYRAHRESPWKGRLRG